MDKRMDQSSYSEYLSESVQPEVTEVIEDEPDRIDLVHFIHLFLKHWKILVILMAVCGALLGILRPGTSSTVIGAKSTLYIPPTAYRTENGIRRPISNNVSQIENALGLITSKVYREEIAEELGTGSVSDYGSYTVTRQKDTQLITVDAVSSNTERAEELCSAVIDVLKNSVGKTVFINEMLEVDPVKGYSNITVTSTLTSVIKGALIGLVLYCIYSAYKYFTDRTFHSKQEAEDYLEVPVLCVLPELKERH